ncbi:uncharacterized protein MONBRDRAFT_16848 [Monosiga brevicollis MX1]|uniref:Uncharacterized protein n=1 Tax=Monosiga brevicollis TaxID=81824 RepID=A9UXV2_MONBE|nr:uncharacterized protein MONBRDRAFT_16848 [Monosiga brevicollis MX1]EDQ89910.1 predicted protein [Monosiga brevicollis MX1]|eukprot:XP_001745332.1 hypothetical protein [Monosiga brevicollis MX1]
MPRPSGRALRETHCENDNVGVQDFVLLENFRNEDAFMNNLKQRFQKDIIYTYIGNVCVSVNPYHQLDIYSKDHIEMYQNVNLYELPPHIFAVADQAYRSMRDELLDQVILISGESGAGKTEASKKILQFLALSSTNTGKAGNIRDRLLQSNPILESFGNAKTIRNDNSSRFGKYMACNFDFKGEPLSGKIVNYLLEKCRVVYQMPGERNFHIFYMLMASGNTALLQRLQLDPQPSKYRYTNQGDAEKVATIDDLRDYQDLERAFDELAFDRAEIDELYNIIGAIVHMGELKFEAITRDESRIQDMEPVHKLAKLLGVELNVLSQCFVHKTVVARGQEIRGDLSQEQAQYACDALAKAMYDRMFSWLVERINRSLEYNHDGRQTVMGLLDIYGFEIMKTNSFEQFCINYCNEKLQQLFIELTLKSEQEEYRNEGIEWEKIDYFNNKIICDMVEERHKGIIAVLDEECLRPGEVSDMTFLERLDNQLKHHQHFLSHKSADKEQRKNMKYQDFLIRHYAGDVVYTVTGFLDKNNDQLFRDLKDAMSRSTSSILQACFPREELEAKRRPLTAGTQFKQSLNSLIETLSTKTPSYVRCIKPNHNKRAGVFDTEVVHHQVKYLGLMENLRVRRAGFAYRRPFEIFLERYKSLSTATWPSWRGSAREGIQKIMDALRVPADAYRMGKTKIFIRNPKTLFDIEDAFQHKRHWIASKIQASYKGYKQHKHYQNLKAATLVLVTHWRRLLAIKTRRRLAIANHTVKLFIRGFNARHKPRCLENAEFLDFVRSRWLIELCNHLPPTILDRRWMPNVPPYLKETSDILRWLHKRYQAKQYRDDLNRKPKIKTQLVQKLAASELFREKKLSYPNSVATWFVSDRLEPVRFAQHPLQPIFNSSKLKTAEETRVKYAANVTKFDRQSYKPRNYNIIVTNKALYVLYPDTFKVNTRIEFTDLLGISVSRLFDGIFVLHTNHEADRDKGDWIFHTPYVIEAVMQIALASRKVHVIKILDTIRHKRRNGTEGEIIFKTGPETMFMKNKEKQLEVICPALPVPQHYQRFKQQLANRGQPNIARPQLAAGPASAGRGRGAPQGRGRGVPTGRGRGQVGPGQGMAMRGGRGRGQAVPMNRPVQSEAALGVYGTPMPIPNKVRSSSSSFWSCKGKMGVAL